jgi:hypothetical protein
MDLVKRDTKEYNFKSLKLDLSFVGDFVFGIAFEGTVFNISNYQMKQYSL